MPKGKKKAEKVKEKDRGVSVEDLSKQYPGAVLEVEEVVPKPAVEVKDVDVKSGVVGGMSAEAGFKPHEQATIDYLHPKK